ncbi:O-antigen ligase family protein [Marinobacter nauticus]|uniref:O-antigen ligase family protein n=1 Tax=Marinobacter nauticus TaxID=2743 RepID=UPI001CD3B0AE|nr:O-antigen ligase family protein [Marinobacter nauticus]MCA0911875.1 O-antigen ligase family protein [Marinobacter nauticus]
MLKVDSKVRRPEALSKNKQGMFSGGFLLIFLYFFFEYLRVQDNIFTFLAPLKVSMWLTLALAVLLIKSNKSVLKDPVNVAVLLIFMEIVLWVPFAKNNFHAYQVAKNMAITLVSVFSIIVVINSLDKLFVFLRVFAVFSIINALWVISHGGTGPGGFLLDENDIALALVTGLPIVFYTLIMDSSKFWKVTGFIGFALILVAVVITSSRGGFLGLLAALFLIIWQSKKKWRNISISIFLAIFMGGLLVNILPDSYISEVQSIKNTQEGTANLRFLHWTTGIEILKDNPFFGVGPNNYPWTSGDYFHLSPFFDEAARFRSGRQAHSLYFTLVPELGFVGIILFSYITLKFFKRIKVIKKEKRLSEDDADKIWLCSKALFGGMGGFLVAGAFISVLYYPIYWHLVALSISMYLIYDRLLINHGRTLHDGR